MNYIELINSFWELDETWQFTCCETRLYFYLLKTANRLGWVDSWTHSDVKMSANVGVSVNSFKTARNKLAQAGLISFDSGGKGQGNKSRYQLRCQNLIPNTVRCQNLMPNHIPKPTPKLIPKATPKVEPKANYTLLDEINVNKTKPPTPFLTNFNLDFAKGKWRDLVLRWIAHKEAIKKPFNHQYRVESFFSELERESDNDLKLAEAIINYSVSGGGSDGWASLVVPDSVKKEIEERKKNKNEKTKERVVY